MDEHQVGEGRSAGAAGGRGQRPAQRLAGPALTFDLVAESEQLRREETYATGDRNAKTLVKEPDLRVVLTVLKEGARLREHQAPGPVAVQTIQGQVRLHAGGQTFDLPTGHLLTLEPDLPHDVEALEESAFLITIGWRSGQHAEG
jgi:quercetin dioxygenase-like cupin family protein